MDKGFDAQKSAHPAATGQIDVVGRLKVQTGGILVDLRTERAADTGWQALSSHHIL